MLKRIIVVGCLVLLSVARAQAPQPVRPPIESSVLYEVNVRQFSEEGSFDAVREALPRLKRMGVGVLWLMPVHPIGEAHRKGTLGSPYSVRDYRAINPEFGTMEDFDELVDAAHDAGMYVIIDWVANHTSWDHVWTEEHPGFYRRDEGGNFRPPNPDWDDVIQLDYDNPAMRLAMKEAMLFWVREHDVDGFRCDVAEMVPGVFWNDTIRALREVKPVFMLAEGGSMWLYDDGFDATYSWALGDAMAKCVRGELTAAGVSGAIRSSVAPLRRHPKRAFRMHFTTNHDWNSWDGTAVERLGDAWECATVLTYVVPGMPMIYSGQEAGLDKRLELFEKDPIEWRDDPARALYERLGWFKSVSPALRAGDPRTRWRLLRMAPVDRVLAYELHHPEQTIVVVVNLSDEAVDVIAPEQEGMYLTMEGERTVFPETIGAWGWSVLERR